MGNVLQFALGIETAEWMHGLTEGGEKLAEFLGVVETGEHILEKFNETLHEGANIFSKSFALGATSGQLYQLGEAFKAVGLEVGEVEPLSFRLQKALTGLSDAGERTEMAFGRLGLNMREIRTLDPTDQILAVSNAMKGLGQNQQNTIASIIFGGRGGAASFLQIARQGDDFADAMKRAQEDAKIWHEVAGGFRKILTTVGEIEAHWNALWANTLSGFVRPLQAVLDTIEQFPWAKIGHMAADAFGGMFKAFEQGKLALLIGDYIETGFKVGTIFALDFFVRLGVESDIFAMKFGVVLIKAFEGPIEFFQAGLEKAIQDGMENLGAIPGIGKVLGLSGFHAQSFDDIYDNHKKDGASLFGLSPEQLNAAANMFADTGRKRSNKNLERDAEQAKGLIGALLGRWPALEKMGDEAERKKTDNDGTLLGNYKPQVTQYEKIGLILNTVSGGNSDYAKRTSESTHRTATLLEQAVRQLTLIPDLLSGKSPLRNPA